MRMIDFAPFGRSSIGSNRLFEMFAGKNVEITDVEYRGIAARPFQRQFRLADYAVVNQPSLANGILSIDLIRELPDHPKPRRIESANGNSLRIKGNAAA